ncbi:MAG TPA: high-affinity branched-chain amino acid ABC transporter permease LivM [Dongiaceae bacterium]|nr:high-affinity branched-chain amino acid ABC transporter permease LivM [Dongiaceae bacterium]
MMQTKSGPTFMNAMMAKDLAVTTFIAFSLSFLLVGFQTLALQGQQLSYINHLGDVAWSVVLVVLGRYGLLVDREGAHRITLVVCGVAAIYLIGSAVAGLAEVTWYAMLPLPFAQPMVNGIFGAGAAILAVRAASNMVTRRATMMSVEQREAYETRRNRLNRKFSQTVGPIMVLLAIFMPITPWGDRGRVDTLVVILTSVMLGWGLNIVVGLAGLLDLGYVAFYAVGAYTYAKMSIGFGWDFWQTLPFAGLFAAMFGVALGFPVLRLRGDYLAIVTLGFGEMIRIVLLNWTDFTSGAQGISGIPYMDFFGIPFIREPQEGQQSFAKLFGVEYSLDHRIYFTYYVILCLALITNFVTIRLRKLPIGRAWEALREDEIACRALGVNPRNTKLTAFGIGAMFAGFAGAFYATRLGFIAPFSFTFDVSAGILAFVVLGGMGSQVGVALAAIILVGLPEVTRELQLYRALIYGCAMVLIMLWRPRGLLSHREPTIYAMPAKSRFFGLWK